jgi:uncharacterized membrane protein YvbJ
VYCFSPQHKIIIIIIITIIIIIGIIFFLSREKSSSRGLEIDRKRLSDSLLRGEQNLPLLT